MKAQSRSDCDPPSRLGSIARMISALERVGRCVGSWVDCWRWGLAQLLSDGECNFHVVRSGCSHLSEVQFQRFEEQVVISISSVMCNV